MNLPSQTVQVNLGDRSYSIQIGIDLWSSLAESLQTLFQPTRLLVISDTTVGPLYEPKLREALSNRDWNITWHQMPAGESHKNLETVQKLYTDILDAGCDRRTVLVALGGGVVGDVAGFVAATLLRGLPYIQVPTTLLAMVDSSVGGKTGVDMPHGKNLIGAFYQPALVCCCLEALDTLPPREFSAGLAEVIKYGVIRDADLFARLESSIDKLKAGDIDERAAIVQRCCEIKAEVVSSDERESGLREILNFGHTVGHAIEAAGGYEAMLHGEAISIGMVVETAIASKRGADLGDLPERLKNLLLKADLPTRCGEVNLDRIWELMHADKKARAGEIRMVLPTRLGDVRTESGITRQEFDQAFDL